MVDWPIPKTMKALRGFLGLTGYYKKFIKGYGQIVAPLIDLLKKDLFGWNDKAKAAFLALKQVVSNPHVLALLDFTKPFVVECDASRYGIVLDNGNLCALSFPEPTCFDELKVAIRFKSKFLLDGKKDTGNCQLAMEPPAFKIHGLPPVWFNRENVELIGGPLCMGIFLPRNDRNDIWISLKYERLLEFCYQYGVKPPVVLHCDVPMIAVDECGCTDIVALDSRINEVAVLNVDSSHARRIVPYDLCPEVERPMPEEVTSFALLLAHSLKDNCHASQYGAPTFSKEVNIKSASPTVETIYFDPETVTVIPEYQLHGYHLEKKAKTDAKSSLKILGWNYRGICNTSIVRALKAFVKGHRPQVIFLCETKATKKCLLKIIVSLGFSEHLIVAAQGKSGGVCLFWSSDLLVEVLEFNNVMVAISIWDNVHSWNLVGFYGPPAYKKRCKSWTNLMVLLGSFEDPWERLDCAIVNMQWRTEFPRAAVFHLGAVNSDHCPLIIDTNPTDVRCLRQFRFEAMWENDPRCLDVINEAWKRNFFDPTEANAIEEARLLDGLNIWLCRNETIWRQKSRETWLKDGDRISKFFHISSVVRWQKNSIDAIRGDDGVWILKSSEIREFIVGKFKELFSEEDICYPSKLEDLIPSVIIDGENSSLCQIPTPTEIKKVLFGMQSLKSLGPDRFPPLFYKKYWEVVGNSVIKAVRNFFITGKMLKEVNKTYIVLIPKILNPSTITHFRPISLCNTIYKIISKLLVDRLRSVILNLVSPAQSAFVPGRWIAENQLIVQEILHSFKKRKVKDGFVVLKLDLQKVYDWVNWGFLKVVLSQFGFSPIFICWIMECISSVSFSILVNGGITKIFHPSRGLRQGDPLSPYLFILGQEVLSRLIDREFLNGSISGVRMNVDGPSFTHVLYTDDIMLFAKASSREVQILDNCLESYCEWSRQRINRNKSGLICSKMVPRDKKREIKFIVAMKKVQSNVKYLGSPLFHSSSRIKDFKFLQEKLKARLLDVPVAICDKLDASLSRFWWNPNNDSSRFLAWKAWANLCAPKAMGGLGFWSAKHFNATLLAKLAWMIVSGCDSPCMCALRNPWVWLPSFLPRPKASTVPNNMLVVANLINLETKSWRFGMLEEMFDLESVNAISNIVLPLVPRNDKLIWIDDPKGMFSVKSALKLHQCHLWPENPDPIWRDPGCPLCNNDVESVSHLFFKCNASKMFWFGTCWVVRADLFVVNEEIDVVKLIVDPPISITDPLLLKQNMELASVQELHWCPPPNECMKLNVDAVVFNDAATIAIIARNESGLITKSWAKSFNSCDPLMAEAVAILWAIQVVKVENWSSIIIESDSKMCVDAILTDPHASLWKIAVLCDNVKTLVAEFSFCCFNWVKREATMVAHILAKAVP
uniref:Reverse transcriptase domain-containing protein n=1 Tax=Fagus sylvatica TaxID=28930 RepID=A0A2N9HI48_FAGSY